MSITNLKGGAYSQTAAKVQCRSLTMGLWQVDYTGPLCLHDALRLGESAARQTCAASATIERYDGANLLMTRIALPSDLSYLLGSAPGCVVVNDDCIELAQQFCRVVVLMGVIRVAFRASEILDALEWTAAMCHV
jgi:hypothetical protein